MKNRLGPGLAGLLLCALSVQTAAAAVTVWSSSEGGRMRIAALADAEPGRITAILEIEPNAGWKTYWRDPGDAGVAPQIDLSSASNLKLVRIAYPAPEIGMDEGGRFIGYHQPVSLVLELERPDPGQPSVLDANVLIGLCKDICLPFQANFALPLDDATQPEADEFMRIQLAKAELPELPAPGFEVLKSGLSSDKRFFEATLIVPGTDKPEVAVAPPAGMLLGKQAEIMAGDGKVTIRYAVTRLPDGLNGAAITLIVKAAGRSMETTLAVP